MREVSACDYRMTVHVNAANCFIDVGLIKIEEKWSNEGIAGVYVIVQVCSCIGHQNILKSEELIKLDYLTLG